VLGILDLAARDPKPSVQVAGLRLLHGYAFQGFEEDFAAYLGWAERTRGMAPALVIQGSVPAFLAHLGRSTGPELAAELNSFTPLPLEAGEACGLDMRALFEAEGALTLMPAWIASGDEKIERSALRWVTALRPNEAWMRAHVIPLAESTTADGNARAEAITALGHPDHAWAKPYLLDWLHRGSALDEQAYGSADIDSAASALAQIGDPSVIPELVQILASGAPTHPRLLYDVGYFGLGKLTGVPYDESHDAAWWLDWWAKNQVRFAGSLGR
jgi:hypothetical protein